MWLRQSINQRVSSVNVIICIMSSAYPGLKWSQLKDPTVLFHVWFSTKERKKRIKINQLLKVLVEGSQQKILLFSLLTQSAINIL